MKTQGETVLLLHSFILCKIYSNRVLLVSAVWVIYRGRAFISPCPCHPLSGHLHNVLKNRNKKLLFINFNENRLIHLNKDKSLILILSKVALIYFVW